MRTIIQADENGALYVPADLLPNPQPSAAYLIEEKNGQVMIVKTECDAPAPFWDTASPQERLAALQDWLEEARTPVGLTDYAVSRESIYD